MSSFDFLTDVLQDLIILVVAFEEKGNSFSSRL